MFSQKAGLIIVLFLIPVVLLSLMALQDNGYLFPKPMEPSLTRIEVGGIPLSVGIARTDAARERGLSERETLSETEGLLFVFDEPGFQGIWMRGMNFPIDIIWIQSGVVADISHDVSNEFDPAAPRFYSPRAKVDTVLEVNAGYTKKHGIKTGDEVVLRNII